MGPSEVHFRALSDRKRLINFIPRSHFYFKERLDLVFANFLILFCMPLSYLFLDCKLLLFLFFLTFLFVTDFSFHYNDESAANKWKFCYKKCVFSFKYMPKHILWFFILYIYICLKTNDTSLLQVLHLRNNFVVAVIQDPYQNLRWTNSCFVLKVYFIR